jgi:hypothetical protein
MTTTQAHGGGFDDWLDAIEAGDPFYLESPEGDTVLPPRRVAPATGSRDLTRRRLPDGGVVTAHTVVHVGAPRYQSEVPYVTAVATFGPVRVTGLVRGVEPGDVETGMPVGLSVVEVGGERTVALEPR